MKALLMAGLAAGAITVACSGKATQDPQAAAIPAMPVKVIEAKALPISDATEYVATLKSRDSAMIMPQVEGHITQIFVHSGDRVRPGAPWLRGLQNDVFCQVGRDGNHRD